MIAGVGVETRAAGETSSRAVQNPGTRRTSAACGSLTIRGESHFRNISRVQMSPSTNLERKSYEANNCKRL